MTLTDITRIISIDLSQNNPFCSILPEATLASVVDEFAHRIRRGKGESNEYIEVTRSLFLISMCDEPGWSNQRCLIPVDGCQVLVWKQTAIPWNRQAHEPNCMYMNDGMEGLYAYISSSFYFSYVNYTWGKQRWFRSTVTHQSWKLSTRCITPMCHLSPY
jgi:hypothetical protein